MVPLVLSPSEETLAYDRWVHVVFYVVEERDGEGRRHHGGYPLSIHDGREGAEVEKARRGSAPPPGIPPGGTYCVVGPWNLLAFAYHGFVDATIFQKCLRKELPIELLPVRGGVPGAYATTLTVPPLTQAESRQAAATKIWFVRYVDRSPRLANPTSFPMAICLSQPEADAEVARRGPLAFMQGYVAEGPVPLIQTDDRASWLEAKVIREVLRRLSVGEAGPAPATMDSLTLAVRKVFSGNYKPPGPPPEPSPLEWLNKELSEGRRPPHEKLRSSTAAEFKTRDPRYSLCATAAAILDDLPLWQRAVAAETGREHRAYGEQRGKGIPKSEIGDVPTYQKTADKMRDCVKNLIQGADRKLSAEILRHLSRFAEADKTNPDR